MLDHLLQAEPILFLDAVPVEDVTAAALLAAQLETAKGDESTKAWLESVQGTDVKQVEKAAAQHAFGVIVTNTNETAKKHALLAVHTPPAVRHLTAMLSEYDWAFIEQARELRGYAVAKILEETKHQDAKIRLQALTLLGKVTEVALFTERHEVVHKTLSDNELDDKIKEKLVRYMGPVEEIETIEIKETAQTH